MLGKNRRAKFAAFGALVTLGFIIFQGVGDAHNPEIAAKAECIVPTDQALITIDVQANGDDLPSGQAVRLGLITTELVINAVKHAFPDRSSGRILVNYVAVDGSWGLSIADDGVGFPAQRNEHSSGGLGTGIIEVLARQLGGWIELTTGAQGTTVAILSARAALPRTTIGPA